MSDPYAPSYTPPVPGAEAPAPWAAPGAPPYPAPQHPVQPGYGHYPGYYPGHYPGPGGIRPVSGLTIAALVVGVIAALVSLVPLLGLVSYLLGPLAMVLGIIGLVKGLHRRGFAVAGVVTGAFALLVCILYTLLLPTLMMLASSDTEPYGFEIEAEGAFQTIVITDNLLAPEVEEHREGFSATMDASPLIGSVTATNAAGNTGQISCVIYDEEGTVLVEDFGFGAGAQAQCLLSDAWGMDPDGEPADFEAAAYLR